MTKGAATIFSPFGDHFGEHPVRLHHLEGGKPVEEGKGVVVERFLVGCGGCAGLFVVAFKDGVKRGPKLLLWLVEGGGLTLALCGYAKPGKLVRKG